MIAEQHLSLTDTYNSPCHFPGSNDRTDPNADFVGEVFLKCNAREVVERCGKLAQELLRQTLQKDAKIPEIIVKGHLNATFPYILSHLEYIVGELMRNSIQAVTERFKNQSSAPPIEVLICEAPQHVIIRISDQGGGIPREISPYLWSFCKGPRTQSQLHNLGQVPTMAATMQELKVADFRRPASTDFEELTNPQGTREGSLDSLSSRPPHLRLGVGLPMSRVYAEYWAGTLGLHSLAGYGVDAFLQISKLGNQNEQVSTRASIDAL